MILLTSTQHMHSISIIPWLSNLIVAVVLLLLYIIYRYFFQKKKNGFINFIRYFLFPFTFISGFFIYFWGYQFGNPHNGWDTIIPNFFESFFSTTRLFILGNDLIEINPDFKMENHLFHALFSLTAALAAFIFISVIAHVFFKDWLIRIKIRKANSAENHFFFGINQSVVSLSTDLIKNDHSRLVVFVNDFCENENQHLYSYLPDEAYVIKCKSFLDSISLEKEEGLLQAFHHKKNHTHQDNHRRDIFHHLRILKKKINTTETHLYFLTDDENWNIQQAKLALNELQNLSIEKPVRIHISTYTGMSEKHFAEYAQLSTTKITVMIHHYASIVSRKLITKHHPVEFIEIDKETATARTDFNTLVIGFGQVGTHVLRKLIEQGQFAGSTFHATVMDKCMNTLRGRFEYLYPDITAHYNINFVEAEAGHTKFYETIKNVIDKTNYIVIALENDDLNIQTALEILEISSIKNKKRLKIFIRLENESHWKETLKEFKEQIDIFGESDNIFTEKNILQNEAERRGMLVHSVYSDLYHDNRSFEDITRHEQLSNISAAEHLYAKAKLLGYENLGDFLEKHVSNDDYVNSLSEIQKLNLSIGEHLRWNAFHFIHGWTALPIEEIEGNTFKEKYINRKNKELKKHSCLTSWEKLKELGIIIDGDMQKADIISVENLYNFINYNNKPSNV